MYKIGELSKLCKIPVKTLRYYDNEGLLVPDKIDQFTGYRYYCASKLADCNRILALKELGFSLYEIQQQMSADPADILALIATKEAELQNVKTQTESQLRRLLAIRKIITEENQTMFHVIIRNTDTIRVAALRKIYADKNEAATQIEKMRGEMSKTILGKRNIIINYETEHCEKDFDLAACVELTGKLPSGYGYAEKTISIQGDAATLVCKKDELDEAYRAMTRYLEEAPCQIIGAFYEIYYDDGTAELKVPVCKLSRIGDKHKNDDINIPFENDPEAIGKWEFVDFVPSEEQFILDKEKSHAGVWLNELYFLPEGKKYWSVAGWTKGYLFMDCYYPKRIYKNKYTIKTLEGQKLLFLGMKDNDYESRGGLPVIWVYKKVTDKEFSIDELRIRDNVNLPFFPDNTVIGKWVVRDFVEKSENYSPDKQYFPKELLYFLSVDFKDDGSANKTLDPAQNRPYTVNWTKGFILDKYNEMASAYEIKKFDGKEYLFIEWKSGDYIFGRQKPYYYVFVKA